MNPANSKQAVELATKVQKGVQSAHAKIVLCPPFVFIPQLLPEKNIQIGAQNCSWKEQGSLTGEVSPWQLKSFGCSYVILGHSERKKYLDETLSMVAKKSIAAKKAGLIPILCVENVAELRSLKVKIRNFKSVVVVFEPSSAISTQGGKHIAPKDIAMMTHEMKKIIGKTVPILYGGSVDAKSIAGIMQEGKVQGVLVGAASLNAREFLSLVKSAL